MPAGARSSALAPYARAGFHDLDRARQHVVDLALGLERPEEDLLRALACAADPDSALARLDELVARDPRTVRALDSQALGRLCLLFGASPGIAGFYIRHPALLSELLEREAGLPSLPEARDRIVSAAAEPGAVFRDPAQVSAARCRLRVAYRHLLARVLLADLERSRTAGVAAFDAVAAALSDLAEAAIEAARHVACAALVGGASGPPVDSQFVDSVRFSVLALGKCGARELNVLSDVDVMFVVDTSTVDEGATERALRVGTRIAQELMRTIHDPEEEPPLWQVDANLRPEGRHGPLVRSLDSMETYYHRWAEAWEFQALLKARPVAGDQDLGNAFVEAVEPLVWSSSSREDFVGSVQRMRERVTEELDEEDREYELKLGPGGLRDIEFSVQLLQLVHGLSDPALRSPGTLPALRALVSGGYIARSDGERLAHHYRTLRTLEHRLQMHDLRRTALMPRETEGLRILARSSGLAPDAEGLREHWLETKREVRELHLKIFYAPVLSAVANLSEDEQTLDADGARARLATIGFRDPDGAIRHLSALTRGASRRARIQRNLLPVLLRWLAEGRDPDGGLLAFRTLSERHADTPWYLRLLRDGTEAAWRLTTVLSSSRYAAELLDAVPEAVAWLERDEYLVPARGEAIREEMRSIAARKAELDDVAESLRLVHRREVLRIVLGRLVGVIGEPEVARGLETAHTALLRALVRAVIGSEPAPRLCVIGLGRYGGGELGFASDVDVIAVHAPAPDEDAAEASAAAASAVRTIMRLTSGPRFSIDLDLDLRPEGKRGPLVRSLESYRTYYERWSLAWEAQALLRARPVAGDAELGASFLELADRIRYPSYFDEASLREVRRLKARMEAERLPRGTDPSRHLKLGPGGLSDVEWLVQLIQLRYAHQEPALRTVSTLEALDAAVPLGHLTAASAARLRDSWSLASDLRSAMKLWSGRNSDVLPTDRTELEGIAGILGEPRGQTTRLEEHWFQTARRARRVFEREFYGYTPETPEYPR